MKKLLITTLSILSTACATTTTQGYLQVDNIPGIISPTVSLATVVIDGKPVQHYPVVGASMLSTAAGVGAQLGSAALMANGIAKTGTRINNNTTTVGTGGSGGSSNSTGGDSNATSTANTSSRANGKAESVAAAGASSSNNNESINLNSNNSSSNSTAANLNLNSNSNNNSLKNNNDNFNSNYNKTNVDTTVTPSGGDVINGGIHNR
jgi:hypothetical protein